VVLSKVDRQGLGLS